MTEYEQAEEPSSEDPISKDASQNLPSGHRDSAAKPQAENPMNQTIAFQYELHGKTHNDNYQWLEDSESADTIAFNARQNERTAAVLEDDKFRQLCEELEKKNTPDDLVIPILGREVVIRHKAEPDSPKGKLLIAKREDYLRDKENTEYELLLDIDELAKTEGKDWFYAGSSHKPRIGDRMLVSLSDGGGDAAVVREFDIAAKRFIDEGFKSEGLVRTSYEAGTDNVYFAVPDSERATSKSGYPLEVRRWDRSGPVEDSPIIFQANEEHMSVAISRLKLGKDSYISVIHESIDFYHTKVQSIEDEGRSIRELPLPLRHSMLDCDEGVILFSPDDSYLIDGKEYQGGLIAFNLQKSIDSGEEEFSGILQVEPNQALSHATIHESKLYIGLTEDVCGRVMVADQTVDKLVAEQSVEATFTDVSLPGKGNVSGLGSCEDLGVLLTYTDFVTPVSHYFLNEDAELGEPFLQREQKFDSSKVEVTQQWAVSEDGTRVPYFVLDGREDKSEPAKTILWGYGGFQVSQEPNYNWPIAVAWLEKGNVFAIANIRGGGEFGPQWHEAALGENRPRAFEDFKAVAEGLVELGFCTTKSLGASGGSNGGLLTGNMLTRYPDSFGAIKSSVPLLDMLRYDQLSRGSSWRAEYGSNENADDYAQLRDMSAYHNIDEGREYPPTLFTTSATDDRVHPGHARKMAALMQNLDKEDIYFFEKDDGGHSGGDFNSWILDSARSFSFFDKFLKLDES